MIKLNGDEIIDFSSEYEKQAKDFCDKTKTNIYINLIDAVKVDNLGNAYRYKVLIKRNGKQMSFTFRDNVYNYRYGLEPTAYDVLACLEKYDPENFDFFCETFGYSNDSIKALEIYREVKKQYKSVMRVFGDVIEELKEIW